MRVIGSGTTLKEVKHIYLTKSENSEIVDTIGAVLVGSVSIDSEYLTIGELTIPTTTDITYESICKDGLTYDFGSTSHKKIYSFSVSRSQETQYQEAVEIIKKQTFGNDYQSTTEWTGWRCTTGPGSDTHRVVMLKDNKINEIVYWITNDYTTLSMLEAVKQNFEGKEPSEELDYDDGSYVIRETQTVEIPADALNLKAIKANNQQNG